MNSFSLHADGILALDYYIYHISHAEVGLSMTYFDILSHASVCFHPYRSDAKKLGRLSEAGVNVTSGYQLIQRVRLREKLRHQASYQSQAH